MNKSTILAVIAIVVLAGASFVVYKNQATAPNIVPVNVGNTNNGNNGNNDNTNSGGGSGGPVACTQEAKLCPDGSSVGRTGPNCAFALCPVATIKNGVKGIVTLSPTCPVVHNPPEPGCMPKPYITSITIAKTDSPTKIIKTIKSDTNGMFSVDLDVGTYSLQALGGQTLPRCGAVSVIVKSGQYSKAEISCDTGIR